MSNYDSTEDTKQHIANVGRRIEEFREAFLTAALKHDASKLKPPEKETVDEVTPGLKNLTYGSEAYKESLLDLHKFLKHHYEHNAHHPQYFKNGIQDMDIIILSEMLCDWKSATERHNDGDFEESLRYNREERFNIPDDVYRIMLNTSLRFGWISEEFHKKQMPEPTPAK